LLAKELLGERSELLRVERAEKLRGIDQSRVPFFIDVGDFVAADEKPYQGGDLFLNEGRIVHIFNENHKSRRGTFWKNGWMVLRGIEDKSQPGGNKKCFLREGRATEKKCERQKG
jgi:hypothetical protein